MQYRRVLQRLRSSRRPSVLGDGLLERARSTSLALLGVTTAVGLAMVGLALNQDWPLVPGSSIPAISPRHQSLGEATIAAEARTAAVRPRARGANGPGRGTAADEPRGAADSTGPEGGGAPAASPELVVAAANPAPRGDGGASPAPGKKNPATKQPKAPQSAPAETASPAPEPSDSTTPVEEPEPAPPANVSTTPSEESSTPSWSSGDGHGYGRGDGWHDRGNDSGDYDRDWGHDGHHWGHSHDDD